jgi:NAD(P)-dependent dehydrogenase (short-subunit alcohol dehydrogenase family)
MTYRLDGKIAVITGAASGIGLASLELFVTEGAKVLAVDLPGESGLGLEQRFPGQVRFQACDVTQVAQLKAAIDTAAAHFGGLDILFSNAGSAGTHDSVENFNLESWDFTQDLLLRSVAAGAAYAIPHMKRRGGGSIINTSSISALQAGYAPVAYSVAKAGVLHFSRIAAAELAVHRIRVNSIVPGFIATSIFGRAMGLNEADAKLIASQVAEGSGQNNPIGRAGLAADIAQAALYLASDASGFMTGAHLTVDGGLSVGPKHSWDPATEGPVRGVLRKGKAMLDKKKSER